MATQVRPKRALRRELEFARKPFYSPSEVAQILGISTQSVLDRIHDGTLYAIRLSPRIYRIPLGGLLQFLGEPSRIARTVKRVRRLPDLDRELATEERSR